MPRFLFQKLFSKYLLFFRTYGNMLIVRGGVAQLGECLNGIQEVVGSIPIVSTTKKSLEIHLFKWISRLLFFVV